MKTRFSLLIAAVLITACGPTKPPKVAGRREPVNKSVPAPAPASDVLPPAMDSDTAAKAEAAAVPVKVEASTTAPAVVPAQEPRVEVVTVYFAFNRYKFRPTPDEAQKLQNFAKKARSIVIRGRTDGTKVTTGEKKVALGRALSVRNYLVSHGTPEALISINSVASSDYVGDNTTAKGRAHNRRASAEFTIPTTSPKEAQ